MRPAGKLVGALVCDKGKETEEINLDRQAMEFQRTTPL
jgi:hypothetical protein